VKAQIRAKSKNLKQARIHTRSALSIILAEVDLFEVPEIRRVGLLGLVNALTMKPHRAQSQDFSNG
jgi:hypothetical protein